MGWTDLHLTSLFLSRTNAEQEFNHGVVLSRDPLHEGQTFEVGLPSVLTGSAEQRVLSHVNRGRVIVSSEPLTDSARF